MCKEWSNVGLQDASILCCCFGVKGDGSEGVYIQYYRGSQEASDGKMVNVLLDDDRPVH